MDRAALEAKFGPALLGKEGLILTALAILKRFNLTAEALSDHWEAFILPRLNGDKSKFVFNGQNLKELEESIAIKSGVQKQVVKDVVKVKNGVRNISGGLDSLYGLATPAKPSRSGITSSAGHHSSSPHASSTPYARPTPTQSRMNSSPNVEMGSPAVSNATPFHARAPSMAVQEALNSHLPLASGSTSNDLRINLSTNADPKRYNYRYMYERMMERSQMLDGVIDEAAEELKRYYGIEDLGDPSVESQEDVIAVGRLCSETDGMKMTPTSTWLESSRSLGSGTRVLLKFQDDIKVRGVPFGSGGMGLFPGCLVGVTGRNGGGKVFGVSEICMLPPPEPTYTKPSALLDYQYGNAAKQLGGKPLSVFIAAGPYTIESDLEYEPLGALIDIIALEKPDLVILIGPFIDANHPMIKAGEIDKSPVEIFSDRISRKLARLALKSPSTIVILVPHARDLISNHVTFPQSPFARDKDLNLPKTVKLLPNPTTFSVNEVVFSITSVDVLFHLTNQQLFIKCQEIAEEANSIPREIDPSAKDMMARACRHLLRQKSFYPIFPAAQIAGVEPLNLDVSHNELIKLPGAADVIILPSMLKHFSKIVDSTIFVNPSFLTKGGAAGTFARLSIHPIEKAELERRVREKGAMGEQGELDEEIEHRLFERCRVDLIKV